MSQHTNRLPFSHIVKAIHCALSLKGCTWACLQALWENFFARYNKGLLCNIKMTSSINVNLSRRWGQRKDAWEG